MAILDSDKDLSIGLFFDDLCWELGRVFAAEGAGVAELFF